MRPRFWMVCLSCGVVGTGCGEDQLFDIPNNTQSVGPIVEANPPEHAFGELDAESSDTQVFMIGNIGDAPLAIQTIQLVGSDADAYEIVNERVSGQTITPGGSYLPVTVAFAPRVRGSLGAALEITSNDPNHNPLLVNLHGVGVVETGDAPVAVCEVHPQVVTPPFETVTFVGAGSYDPSGSPLTGYMWRLSVQPVGSAVAMPSCGNQPDCAGFAPDVAGTYSATLTVQNEEGLTDSCTVSLEAIPDQELWIEMYWTHERDDMDLHLLAPGGSPRTRTDCYYMNCVRSFLSPGLDWGQPNYDSDDPRLDLDDIKRTGPENINLDEPGDGVYTVFVNDYPGTKYQDANDVTVNVYVNGVKVFHDTRTVTGENSDNYFCEVEWPGGVINPL